MRSVRTIIVAIRSTNQRWTADRSTTNRTVIDRTVLSRASDSRKGMALLVILVLIVMAALGAYSFTFTMESQYRITRLHEDQVHARLAAMSAVEIVAGILEQSMAARAQWGPLDNNPDLFGGIQIDSTNAGSTQLQSSDTWRASIISPRLTTDPEVNRASIDGRSTQPSSFVFGLQNETAKIHLPTLAAWDQQQPGYARQILLSLPGATADRVDALLAAITAQTGPVDNLQMSGGMSQQPLGGEIFRGRGVGNSAGPPPTGRIPPRVWPAWLGQDLNQNYQLDPIESALQLDDRSESGGLSFGTDGGSMSLSPSPSLGQQTPSITVSENSLSGWAWRNYLTWHNGGRHETVDGKKRIFLNQPNLQNLHRQLMDVWPVEWANYVIAFRQYGGQMSGQNLGAAGISAGSRMEASQIVPDFSLPPSFSLRSPLELIGGWVLMPASPNVSPGNSSNSVLLSPLRDEISAPSNYLSRLLDDVTTDFGDSFVGRVDINDAPQIVLTAVPGMTRQLADQIVQRRLSSPSGLSGNALGQEQEASPRGSIAWLLEEGLVDLPQLIRLEPYLTARSDVYSCQAVGFKDDNHAVYRCTFIIDARVRPATTRDFQIWHTWDRGFDSLSLSPRDNLRSVDRLSSSATN